MTQLERALMKAHAAGDDRAARQIAAEIKRVRAQDAKPEPMSRTEAFVRGVERGMRPVGDVMQALDPVSNIVNYFFPSIEKKQTARQARLAKEAEQAVADRPGFFAGGKITGEIAATAPLIATGGGAVAATGGRLARVGGQMAARGTTGGRAVQKVGRATQAAGRAVQTGGMGVRAPTRTAVAGKAPIAATRKGRMALRVGGGAGAGTAAAVLTDQDLTDAALAGAVIPLVGTISRRGLGYIYDKVRGRAGPVKAAEVLRNLIADNPTAIANALRDAPADARQSTAQFLADEGLLTSELAAATRIAEASNFGKPLEQQALQRAAARRAQQAELRGGETQAEAMENVSAMKAGARQTAEPYLEEAMRAANVGRNVILPLERGAGALERRADELAESGVVRRMRGLEGRSLEQLDAVFQNPEFFTPGRVVERIGEVAEQAGRRADEGIDAQLFMRNEAARARAVAEDLRAQGYAPIDISPVVGRLRQLANDAFAVSPQRQQLFTAFANALEQRAARNGGVIDAEGLHLAKRDMNEFVASVLGQADPSALKRGTSMMLGQTQKLITDAIDEAAGPGTPFAEFNRVFSGGMRRAEQQDFARELAKLTPQRFEKVMENQDPEFVKEYFPDKIRIEDVLPPELRDTARQLNRQIAADLDVSAGGLRELPRELRGALPTGARRRVEEALEPGLSPIARGVFRVTGGVPGISGGSIAAEQIAREYAQRMSSNAMRNLVPAMVSPQAASNLLAVRSANNKMAEFVNSLAPSVRAALGQALVQGQMGAVQPVPEAAALPEIDVPGADMPFSNITYDEFGNYIGPR
jgi:hypothetical protein